MKHLHFIALSDHTVGNTFEELIYALFQARREEKKLVLLYRPKFGAPFYLRRAPAEVYRLQSPYIHESKALQIICAPFFGLVYGPLPQLYKYFSYHFSVLLKCLGEERKSLQKFSLKNLLKNCRKSYRYLISFGSQIHLGDSLLFNIKNHKIYSPALLMEHDWTKEYDQHVPISVEAKTLSKCVVDRIKMGIPEGEWFVCLHVREGGYHNDWPAIRNSNIENYTKGIKYITDRGGWVVRMGDSSMKPLPKMEKVIDYPHTSFKSAQMDLYLMQECKFFIGCNSGLFDLARVFQKRILSINQTEWTMCAPLRPGDMALIKHYYSRSKNRFLALREIFESYNLQDLLPVDPDYKAVENSPDEIYDAVMEFMAWKPGTPLSELQLKFQGATVNSVNRWFKEKEIWAPAKLDVINKYRIACRTLFARGALSQKFLEANWEVSSKNSDSQKRNDHLGELVI